MKSHHPHTFQITKYVFCSRIVFPRDARVNDKIVCVARVEGAINRSKFSS